MALPKVKVPIALNTPLDTKGDEFLTPGFAILENVRHKKSGGLIKRNGYTQLTQEIANTSGTTPFTENISNALALKSYKDEIVLLSKDGVFSYSSHNATNANSWLTRDYVNKAATIGSSLVRKDSSALTASLVENTAISKPAAYRDCHYLETTDYKIISADDGLTTTVSVLDINTGATIIQRQFLMFKSNIATDSTYLYILGQQYFTNDFIYYPIPLVNLNFAASPVTLSGLDFNTNNITSYDVVSDTSQVFMVTAKDTGGQYYALAYTISNTTATNTGTTNLGADYAAVGPLEIRLTKFQNTYRMCYGYNTTTTPTIRLIDYSSAGAVTSGPTSIGDSGFYISICSDSNNSYIVYNKNSNSVKLATINAAGTVTITTFSDYGWFPQSQPVVYDNHIYIAVRGEFTNIGHNIVVRKNLNKTTGASLFAKAQDYVFNPIYIDYLGSNTALTGFPRMFLNGNSISFASRSITDVISSTNLLNTNLAPNQIVSTLKLSFDSAYKSVNINSGLLVSGSLTKVYDGTSYTELGFLQSPVITAFTLGAYGVGGEFINGTYGMAAVYCWVDTAGNIHRSAPEFKSVVVTGGPLVTLDFTFRTLKLTEKENFYTELYLTAKDGSIYYKTTVSTSTGVGSFVVAANTSAEVLYTQSGELENDPPEANIGITYFKNRLFTVSRNKLQFSKPIEANAPAEFSGLQTINLEADGGDATGVYGMDNNLIIFKKNAIYQLSGEGPNALGQQSDYGTPQLITTDTGCIEGSSIIAYPNGILFKSKKGIYELNRGLYAQYIGAQVADFNDYSILSSTLLPEVNEIRFVLSSGQILVYDYQEKQWSVDTVLNALSGTSLNNVYYYVNSSSVVEQENALYFDNYKVGDALVPYSAKIATNWIQVVATNNGVSSSGGVQQWQRLYKIHLLGRYKSAHTLRVSLSYNYDDTIIDYATITPSGSGLYQFVVKPSIQKCEAVKITIMDTNTSNSNGESMELSSLILEMGVKQTAQKQGGDSKSAAAT